MPYRVTEFYLADVDPLKPGTRISLPRDRNSRRYRRLCRFSMGFDFRAIEFCPDGKDGVTAAAGAQKRICFEPPKINRARLRRFKEFVARRVRELYLPLDPNQLYSLEWWLALTNYPEWRKNELREADKIDARSLGEKLFTYMSFIKDETYPEPKQARTINSPHDKLKCMLGPYMKAIEKIVFADPWFIKKVPVSERPAYIRDRLMVEGAKILATDFSSFESSFRAEIMEACELALYAWMLSALPEGDDIMTLLRSAKTGMKKLRFAEFMVDLLATRMSGEMDTSLGNGFTNRMINEFLAYELNSTIVGVVEGDDGLIAWVGDIPSVQDFADLGFVIKLEVHSEINTASFCGLVFDTVDLLNVTDPAKVMATFGWMSWRYAKAKDSKVGALLRCKALSLAYQYPGCPIVSELAFTALRLTRSLDIRSMSKSRVFNEWQRDLLDQAMAIGRGNIDHLKIEPPARTRLMVSELYGIPVSVQEYIEQQISNMEHLSSFHDVVIDGIFPKIQVEHYEQYTVDNADVVFERPSVYPLRLWKTNKDDPDVLVENVYMRNKNCK